MASLLDGVDGAGEATPIGVAALTERIRGVLSAGFAGRVVVAGEVSGFRERNHWYFALKEQDAVVSCVCWSRDVRRLSAGVTKGFVDGAAVVVMGRVDYYPPQGRLQLYVEKVELAGRGALEEQLDRLKAELSAAGYFLVERKRGLPLVPTKVAVVTSRSGAALRDVEQTARQRWAGCELVLVDVRVQGASAAGEVASAVDWLSEHGTGRGVEVVMIVRGGGSLEDLWAFNERVVADAIYRCRLPVVTGVGHEPDVTVAQLVADVGSATPTQAAMAVVPERGALDEQVDQWSRRLRLGLRRGAERAEARLERLTTRGVLAEPGVMAASRRERLARAAAGLGRGLSGVVRARGEAPQGLGRRLGGAMKRRLASERARVAALSQRLEAVGPMAVLRRGYTLTRGADGALVRSSGGVRDGQRVTTVTGDGSFESVVGDGGAGDPPVKRRKPRGGRGASGASGAGGLFG
ncbi:MAG: exodeoxyribonuclease VII large subunit [Planctomycetota bacterium]